MLTIELGGLGASAIAVKFYDDVGKISARGSKIVRRERFSSVLSPALAQQNAPIAHACRRNYLGRVEPFILIAITQYACTGLA
jgi:hypothetical protein